MVMVLSKMMMHVAVVL